jgi:hypothetical protein
LKSTKFGFQKLINFKLKIMKYSSLIAFCFYSIFLTSCTSDTTKTAEPEVIIDPVVVEPIVNTPLVSEVGLMWSYAPESSGIVLTNGSIYTFNDSGNPNVFYKVNPADGTLLQSITVTNFPNVDWEDITADDNYIYLGDFGNNDGIRKDLKVLKISKAQFINETAKTVNVTAEAIAFSYNEQTSFISSSTHNFDCETIISKADNLYIFTKNRGDNKTSIYKLSKTPGQYSVSSLASYNVNGLVTGGDYNAQTNEVILVGYSPSGHKNSFVYSLTNFNDDSFFSGTVVEKIIGNSSNDWQTEGIAFGSLDGKKIYLSCETTAFSKAQLYSTDKTTLGF